MDLDAVVAAWFKRRFGLLNTARGLLDEPAPVSSWLSSLLSVLLRWPGTDIKGASAAKLASAKTRVELLKAIHDRIAEQRFLYGERSGAPMYVVQTQEDRELRSCAHGLLRSIREIKGITVSSR